MHTSGMQHIFLVQCCKGTFLVGCGTDLTLFQSELGKNKYTHNHNFVVRPMSGGPVGSQCTSGCLDEALLPAAVGSTDSC